MSKILLTFLLCGGLWLSAQSKLPTLAGSWEFTETPNSNPRTEVTGLATFTSDGSLIETDTSAATLNRTPGHGIWQPSPAFGNWYIRFVNLSANADGTLATKRIVTMSVALNSQGTEFSGGYSFETVDASGHEIATGTGTVKGQLMVHPELP